MKIERRGEVLESWEKFVKFLSKHANLYPFVELGDECEQRTPYKLNPEAVLKRTYTSDWLKCISDDASKNCLALPHEIAVVKVSSEPINWVK